MSKNGVAAAGYAVYLWHGDMDGNSADRPPRRRLQARLRDDRLQQDSSQRPRATCERRERRRPGRAIVRDVLREHDGHIYGDEFTDLAAFVRDFGSVTGEPACEVRQSRCDGCGATTFWMECSEEDGVAKRTCTSCHSIVFIGDSAGLWDEADTGDATCPCHAKVFEIAVGFCVSSAGEVDWVIVGGRCIACQLVGVYADWCVEYASSVALQQT